MQYIIPVVVKGRATKLRGCTAKGNKDIYIEIGKYERVNKIYTY